MAPQGKQDSQQTGGRVMDWLPATIKVLLINPFSSKVKQAEFLQGAGRAQARRTYLEENMPFISMNSSLKASESQIRKINKRLRALRARAEENPEAAIQLAEQEEQLEEMKKAVYDRFNKRFSVIVGN